MRGATQEKRELTQHCRRLLPGVCLNFHGLLLLSTPAGPGRVPSDGTSRAGSLSPQRFLVEISRRPMRHIHLGSALLLRHRATRPMTSAHEIPTTMSCSTTPVLRVVQLCYMPITIEARFSFKATGRACDRWAPGANTSLFRSEKGAQAELERGSHLRP
jgi:hypothetical protein